MNKFVLSMIAAFALCVATAVAQSGPGAQGTQGSSPTMNQTPGANPQPGMNQPGASTADRPTRRCRRAAGPTIARSGPGTRSRPSRAIVPAARPAPVRLDRVALDALQPLQAGDLAGVPGDVPANGFRTSLNSSAATFAIGIKPLEGGVACGDTAAGSVTRLCTLGVVGNAEACVFDCGAALLTLDS